MKMNLKFSTLILALLTITLFSCKDDEDVVAQNTEKMIGGWDLTSYIQSGCTDSDNDVNFTFGADGACFSEIIGTTTCVVTDFTFNADETLVGVFVATTTIDLTGTEVNVTTETVNGTWRLTSATEMEVCLENDAMELECSTGTYVITDTTFNYSGSNSDNGCDVSLSATKQ